jgi:hypothetical protein
MADVGMGKITVWKLRAGHFHVTFCPDCSDCILVVQWLQTRCPSLFASGHLEAVACQDNHPLPSVVTENNVIVHSSKLSGLIIYPDNFQLLKRLELCCYNQIASPPPAVYRNN